MEIRRAVPGDGDAVRALLTQLFAANAEFAPAYHVPARAEGEYPMQSLEDESSAIFVAVIDGEVAGFAHVNGRQTPELKCFIPMKYAFLNELAVDEKRRGQGIGRALVDTVKQWARERGMGYVELNFYDGNDGARHLYESCGFAPVTHNLRVML